MSPATTGRVWDAMEIVPGRDCRTYATKGEDKAKRKSLPARRSYGALAARPLMAMTPTRLGTLQDVHQVSPRPHQIHLRNRAEGDQQAVDPSDTGPRRACRAGSRGTVRRRSRNRRQDPPHEAADRPPQDFADKQPQHVGADPHWKRNRFLLASKV